MVREAARGARASRSSGSRPTTRARWWTRCRGCAGAWTARSSTRRRSPIRASRCATRSWRCRFRSSSCTSPTSSPGSPSGGTRCIADLAIGLVDRLRRPELPPGAPGAGGPSACRLTGGSERQAALRRGARGGGAGRTAGHPSSQHPLPDRLHRLGRAAAGPRRGDRAGHRLPLRGAGAGRGGRRGEWWRWTRRASGTGSAGCWRRCRRARSASRRTSLTVRDAERVAGAYPEPGGADEPTWSSDSGRSSRRRRSPRSARRRSWRRMRWPRCSRRSGWARPSRRSAPRSRPRSGGGAASGTRSRRSSPRARARRCRTRAPAPATVEPGEWLLLDFGAQVDGYCADLTRTVVVGGTGRRAAAHDVRAGADAPSGRALEHLRPGMTGREADALAREVIAARGFGDAFGHSLGHGLGPRSARGAAAGADRRGGAARRMRWSRSSRVSIFPGWGGVRLEDDVYLGADGPGAALRRAHRAGRAGIAGHVSASHAHISPRRRSRRRDGANDAGHSRRLT